MRIKRISICVALAFTHSVFAAEPTESTLSDIKVVGQRVQPLPALSDSALDGGNIVRQRTTGSDAAKLLDGQPGVSLYGAGGVSSLPVIHGMADDRIRVKVDGMDLVSACANHMNPPLSYIAPANVGSVKVLAGISPVSSGGDSIGGTILVDSSAPEFAQPGAGKLLEGQASVFYRSNGNAQGANLSAAVANETLRMNYSGATTSSGDYKAAKDFKAAGLAATGRGWLAGDEVGSSRYKSENHALGFAMRRDSDLVELKLGLQKIPYQGFPNQRMDMTGNDSQQINLRYIGQYQWGMLEARAYNEHTQHKMQFGDDKLFWYGAGLNVAGMPMQTDGKNTGVQIKGDIMLSERDVLRTGMEYQQYRLSDWWDPVANSAMMSPTTFQNINNGKRDRLDVFAEWEANWNQEWLSQLGLRIGSVKMDTGAVQGYNTTSAMANMNYKVAAAAFNALNRQRTDNNFDLTALTRFTPDKGKTFEAGYAVKTRAPNLYERYTWSNTNSMVMNMNNWVGDGNGYVGNINLKPEVAHTLSVTGDWHDDAQEEWNVKVTPYYTRVNNYIDAAACTAIGITCPARTDGFLNLSFANQAARLYGADVSGKMALGKVEGYGSFRATGVLNYVNGKNLTTGDNLYNIMPLNLRLAVEQRAGSWTNTIEAKLVDAKTNVQATRKELRTGGYGLLNLYSSYEWKQARFDVGLENALNKFYSLPLGGAYVGQGSTMGTTIPYGTSVPGMGRSLVTSLTLKF